MKRAFAILLAIMMVLSMAATAFADGTVSDGGTGVAPDTTTLTVNTEGYADRTFNAYQILFLTNAESAFYYTVNDTYRDALVSALNLTATDDKSITDAIAALTTGESVRHFADALYRAIQAAGIPAEITDWDGSAMEVEQGYWLIVDVTDLSEKNEANSLVILDTAGDADVTVNLKADKTSSDKKVDDENDSIANITGDGSTLGEDERNWQEHADYDIGDKVPFVVTGQVANDIVSYNYYAFKIVDVAGTGLTHLGNTAEETNIQLLLNGQAQTIKAAGTEGEADWIYEITKNNELFVYPNYGYTTNAGENVGPNASYGGDLLKLFPEGTSHDEINSSTFTLRYNCLLNEDAVIGGEGNKNDAYVVVSNNPYADGFGETPLDSTVTFTYKFVVDKTDPDGDPLTGAQFSLYKFIAEGSGTYTGEETVAATASEAALNGKYFNHPAANSYGKFELVDRLTINDEGTEFTFNGIDDGYYVLIETTVPDGYKGIEPVEFHVVASHNANEITELKAVVKGGTSQTISGDTATGTLTAVIENHTGSELPSTGGMGTTLFYVCGGLMTVGALVLLVTKKRMSV